MALPTYDELLRAVFNDRKAQAQNLIGMVVSESASQYAALETLAPELFALAAYFKEPLIFEVDVQQALLKQRVMEVLGPIVKASAEAEAARLAALAAGN